METTQQTAKKKKIFGEVYHLPLISLRCFEIHTDKLFKPYGLL